MSLEIKWEKYGYKSEAIIKKKKKSKAIIAINRNVSYVNAQKQ